MMVTVQISGALRPYAAGRTTLSVEVPEPGTVGAVFDRLAADFPALDRRVRDERGIIRQHVNVFVGDTNVRDIAMMATPVSSATEIFILPSISGG